MTAKENSAKQVEIDLLLAFKRYVNFKIEAAAKRAVDEKMAERAKEPDENATRWIYFIQGVSGGAVKIGVANDPKKRLADLQRTSPIQLRIVAARPGDIFQERELHERFAEHRLHGEWFEPCDELVALIRECAAVEAVA